MDLILIFAYRVYKIPETFSEFLTCLTPLKGICHTFLKRLCNVYVLLQVNCTRMVKFKSRISHMSTYSTVILLYKGNYERMTVL